MPKNDEFLFYPNPQFSKLTFLLSFYRPNHRTPSLVIGYHNGFQIWDMSRAHQESHTIHEIISKQWDASVTIAAVRSNSTRHSIN
jgi:hypothetical protein